ncbi:MAG: CDP-diacylglycerol--glycerol-3-phosphate 3-phosphatidyltransferase [Clostridia bacterium]|nr:CDP-diacylglycerol--glycerol-3-phosphate 3-phosphatidyltransferase [Clostridia bacterium]
MRHIPNILTCLRILMVIAFIILFVHAKYLICLILYLAAFFTDILDGYLARRFNWVSDFGKLVDPFADKFMLISALICLCAVGAFPLYLLAILIVKEIVLITGGLVLLKKRKVAVYADYWGKVATGLFVASITLSLANLAFGGIIPRPLLTALYILALSLSVFSLFHYAYMGGFIGKKYRDKTIYESSPEEE